MSQVVPRVPRVELRRREELRSSPEVDHRGIQCYIEVDKPEATDRDIQMPTVDTSRIDFIQINRWLDSCESCSREQPGNERSGLINLHENLRLYSRIIDVVRLRVIPAPERCRYVALSYVWGGRQKYTLRDDNERFFRKDRTVTPERCSQSVWDAVILCREIGERYLWVDSFCIIQDTEDKHAQIQAIEEIYRGAVLTVVAAARYHADAGLPGAAITPRNPRAAGDKLEPADPNLFDILVNRSVWNTRAWTYQERVLSQRLLVFTDEQMFFHCSHSTTREGDVDDPHEAPNPGRSPQPAHTDAYRLQLDHNINFNIFAQITQEYSKRTLTYEEDIENAFRGIKKIVSLLFRSEVIFCIPIAALDISLLWYPVTEELHRQRRMTKNDLNTRLFPSWSWAGWVGPVYYKDLANISERTISSVRWKQPEDLRTLYASGFGKDTLSWPSMDGWFRRVTPKGQPYYVRDGNPSRWFSHPVERFLHDPIPLERDTGVLHFSADKAPCDSWRLEDPGSSGSHVLRIFHRETGSQLGKVFMHVGYDPKEDYKLLKISSTTLTHGDKDPAWRMATAQFSGTPGEPPRNRLNMDISSASEWFDPAAYDPTICFCLYNVLMVVVEGGITYRVGIGKVYIHAFDEFAFRDQHVRLG